jgi:methyl coenzyme M reductase beta subunit
MPHRTRVEARIAAVCFSALGASILSAWAVGSFAPGHAQTAAGVGLAFPLVAAALTRLRRRRYATARPARSHA